MPTDLSLYMNEPLGLRRHRDKAHFVTLPLDTEKYNAFPPLIIAHAERTELLSPDVVKEERREDRAVADAFERLHWRGLQ
jgi:hypothetical protein